MTEHPHSIASAHPPQPPGHDAVQWTAVAADDGVLGARVAAQTDIAVLRTMLAAMRKSGNLRWVVAIADRIAALSPAPAELATHIRARLGARDIQRARALFADLPAEFPSKERRRLAVDLAEAEGNAEAMCNLRNEMAAAEAGSQVELILREAAIRLGCGDLDAATRTLDEARQKDAPAAALAVLDVRLSLLTDGPAAALAVLDARSEILSPSSAQTRALRLRLLNARGRWREATDLALGWISEDASLTLPPSDDMLAQALHAAMMADRLSDLQARLRDIESRFPGHPALVETLCIGAIEEDDALLVEEMMEKMRQMDRWRWLVLALRHACHTGATAEVDALRALLRSEGCFWPGPDVMTGLFSYYFDVTSDRMALLLDEMGPLFDRSLEDPGLQALRLRMEIALNRDKDARRHLETLPHGLRQCAELTPFGMYFAAKDGHDEGARDGWRRWIADTAPTATDACASHPETRVLRFTGHPGEILCFVCVYNGIEYVDWFLEHYRRLGVDHFFFCDNASTDGTAERLLEQPDVSLFHAPGSFAASGCGIFWINHLMRRFGVGHWCIHVDMDEALVFAGVDRGRDLHDLTRYLDAQGHGCTEAAMIDMVPPGFPRDTGPGPVDFVQSSCFDADLVRMPCELPPYSFIKGGVRSRMTGRSLLMTKSPLVRMTPDFAYLVNNHHHTHVPVSDLRTAVLHFKFIGAYRDRLADAIARREHFQGARFYRQLDRSLGAPSASSVSNALIEYDGPAQLVSLGLMHSSPGWDAPLPHEQPAGQDQPR